LECDTLRNSTMTLIRHRSHSGQIATGGLSYVLDVLLLPELVPNIASTQNDYGRTNGSNSLVNLYNQGENANMNFTIPTSEGGLKYFYGEGWGNDNSRHAVGLTDDSYQWTFHQNGESYSVMSRAYLGASFNFSTIINDKNANRALQIWSSNQLFLINAIISSLPANTFNQGAIDMAIRYDGISATFDLYVNGVWINNLSPLSTSPAYWNRIGSVSNRDNSIVYKRWGATRSYLTDEQVTEFFNHNY